MTAPFLFDDLPSDTVVPEETDTPAPSADYPFKTETERITCRIMGELDCLIPDEVPDKRYDAAQARIEKIIREELTHEEDD